MNICILVVITVIASVTAANNTTYVVISNHSHARPNSLCLAICIPICMQQNASSSSSLSLSYTRIFIIAGIIAHHPRMLWSYNDLLFHASDILLLSVEPLYHVYPIALPLWSTKLSDDISNSKGYRKNDTGIPVVRNYTTPIFTHARVSKVQYQQHSSGSNGKKQQPMNDIKYERWPMEATNQR
uniref:Uncharacterized protein n=1 Tax=Glossina austeni TaxID=7395 RepID=A0A1A9VFJ3_GLOAU